MCPATAVASKERVFRASLSQHPISLPPLDCWTKVQLSSLPILRQWPIEKFGRRSIFPRSRVAQEAAVSVKSLEEYREVARLVRALATQASEEEARGTLLGMADFLEYFARRAESKSDGSHPTDQREMPLSGIAAPTGCTPHNPYARRTLRRITPRRTRLLEDALDALAEVAIQLCLMSKDARTLMQKEALERAREVIDQSGQDSGFLK